MARPVAVITGASRGIGRALCGDLAAAGYDIACCARSSSATASADQKLSGSVEAAAEEAVARGGRAIAVGLDVRDEQAIAELCERVYKEFGRCDLVVNNAAIAPPKPALDDSVKRWKLAVDINVNGPFYFSYYFGKKMRDAGEGRIINISSGVSTHPEFGRPSYTATKRALEGMTEAMAYELKGTVGVNCIRIEIPVLTEGFAATLPKDTDFSRFDDTSVITNSVKWLGEQPLDYTGKILEVADLRKLGATGEG